MSVKVAPRKTSPKRRAAAKKKTVTPSSGRPPSRPVRRRRSTKSGRCAAGANGNPAAGGLGQVDPQELHRRWENAHRVIRDAVGQEDEHDPRIWERGVYQLWLWLVIERLVVRRDEIEVSELSVISKMLHEQRKLSLEEDKQQQKAGDKQSNGLAQSTRLPAHFGQIVRQIYGTNFQDDAAPAEIGTADVRG